MRIELGVALILLAIHVVNCTNPIIAEWAQYDKKTTYNSSKTGVTYIAYDSSSVYIKTNGLPSYLVTNRIYSWSGISYKATAQNYAAKFPLTASQNTGTKTATVGGGANGFWVSGAPIYTANDGTSYNSVGVWHKDFYALNKASFDVCTGRPDSSGRYEHIANPLCLYDDDYTTSHSEILGWAFDGYPVYGPYGYSSANNTGSTIRRMLSGYKLRTISARNSLWDGTALNSTLSGPTINNTYPLGTYIEDWGWSSSNGGDLDQYNGRYCKTPEYPTGTYAYFITTSNNGTAAFPYTLAAKFYGNVLSTSTSVSVPTTGITQYFTS